MNKNNSLPILLVDDEAHILKASKLMLQSSGFRSVSTTTDPRTVMPMLAEQPAAVIVLDLFMPLLSGQELLQKICSCYPETAIIVMTALDETQSAVDCMRAGAFDYLVKPVESARLVASVSKALELYALSHEVSTLKEYLLNDRLSFPAAFASIITRDKRMRAIFQYIEVIAASRQPILITGETGVGKDLLAKAIHSVCRCRGEFVAVNVAGLDDVMFSDTLFGHKRGAYTGADQAREGLIARAAGGTIFLDEIGDLSDSSQIKLLRLLQEHEYYPVGSDLPRKSDARVIVATNKSLKALMASGKFRNDLYYRLCTHQIEIPPLRERRDDVPLLVDHFMQKAGEVLGRTAAGIPSDLFRLLADYDFPGNVRELEAMVHDAVARQTSGVLPLEGMRHMLEDDTDTKIIAGSARSQDDPRSVLRGLFGHFPAMREMEDLLMVEALKESGGNQGAAAALLGITRQTLNKRLGDIRKSTVDNC